MALTILPHQVRGKTKCRSIPLFPIWAFLACDRVSFMFINEHQEQSDMQNKFGKHVNSNGANLPSLLNALQVTGKVH